MKYFGRWDDPAGAEAEYLDWLAKKGKIEKVESQVKKPYPDFPLTPHKGSGKWCVKIKSHFHYFGRLDDPQGALDEFKAVEDDLRAGRTPCTVQGLTVKQVINSWLGVKAARVASGELKPRSLADYTRISTAMAESLGSTRPFASLGPADFEKLRKDFAKTHGPVRLSGDITVARMIVRHAQRFHLIVVEPGPTFIKPSALTLRRERGKKPPRYFKPKEFRKLLKAAKEPLRTMLLLALNCGFSNADCAELKVEDVNPRSPLLKIPRTKTAMPRTCYLWPETRKALQEVIAARPKASKAEDAGLVFITKYGNPFRRTPERGCQIAKETLKLLKATGLYRANLNFGALRHTFLSVAEDTCSKSDVDLCMGHRSERRHPEIELTLGSVPSAGDMSANYRETRRKGALRARLKRLARAVHNYAFNRPGEAKSPRTRQASVDAAAGVMTPAAASPPAAPESSPTPRKKSGSGAAPRRASRPR